MFRRFPVAGKTIDAATAITLLTQEITADGAILVSGSLVCTDAGMTAKAVAFFPRFLVTRATGTLASPASQTATATQPTDGGAAQAFQPTGVSVAFSGNFLSVNVNGVAATTALWAGELTIAYAPAGSGTPDPVG